MATGFQAWSQTAASNATADSSVNWAEGQAPSSVNDSARAMMSVLAKWRDDNNGTLTSAGGTTAYTLATNTVFTSLAAGNQVAFTMNATNTGTSTLNVDGLGAKPLRSAAAVETLTGSLLIGGVYRATYFTTNSGEWIIQDQAVLGAGAVTAAMLASNAVTTAKITDANVTLAKIVNTAATRLLGNPTVGAAAPSEVSVTGPLAFSGTALTLGGTTTAHGVALWEGTSAMGNTGAGTVGQALVSNGASADPSFQSGGWVLLNTLTASTSAALQDTTSLTSAYTCYQIVLENLIPVTDGVSCKLQVHSGGSYQTTGYLNAIATMAGSSIGSASNTGFMPCSGIGQTSNSSVNGVSGTMNIHGPVSGTTYFKSMYGTFTAWTGSFVFLTQVGGWWNTASAIDGFQVSFSSGNIASGTIRVYGRL